MDRAVLFLDIMMKVKRDCARNGRFVEPAQRAVETPRCRGARYSLHDTKILCCGPDPEKLVKETDSEKEFKKCVANYLAP